MASLGDVLIPLPILSENLNPRRKPHEDAIPIDNNQIKKQFQVKKDFKLSGFKITGFKFKNKLKFVILKTR